MGQALEIVEVLREQRRVHVVVGLNLAQGLVAHRFLAVEGAARRHSDQEERQRDGDQEHRDEAEQSPCDEVSHAIPALRVPGRGP